MTRRTFVLANEAVRNRAIIALDEAPVGSRVEIKGPARSLDQNARFWAMLGDVSEQLAWHGQILSPEDWKLIFLSGLKQEARIAPNIDNNGFVYLGRSSSDLSVAEFSDLFEIMEAFAAREGVVFHSNREAV